MAGNAQVDDSRIVLAAEDGFRVAILRRGASIQTIEVRGQSDWHTVCLGYADPACYRQDRYFMGSTVGRYAGRIDRGRLPVDGTLLRVAVGEVGAPHCLHGGPEGFHTKDWTLEDPASCRHATLRLTSPAGDQGFPGELHATVRYEVLDGWRLAIDYHATCTSPTVVNLANHVYFNLEGDGRSILDHVIRLYADQFTPLCDSGIPCGEVSAVDGTALDLRRPTVLREHLGRHPSLHNGLDHNVVISGVVGELRPAAEVHSPRTGLSLSVRTTQPGLQVYTGGNLGPPFARFGGLCLEAQNFPDAPNHHGFPDPWLRPGETYRQRTEYGFKT